MNISRRQLYAAGEPLGEGATRRVGNRTIFGDGGGGGGNQKVENTNIPEYARPYVEDMLGRSQALTTQNPYQPYGGERIAGPTGMQQQSYGAASSMQPAAQIGQASGIATNVANRAGQAGQFTPGNFSATGPMMTGTGSFNEAGVAQSYMNPYMQAVVDIQKREATRNSDMQGQQQGAQAVGAGAFGGSRHAIVDAERQRNLGTQLNDIQAQGSNAAFNQAQQAFMSDSQRQLQAAQGNQQAWTNFGTQNLQAQQMGEQSRQYGAGLGLQGLQTQLGAGQLLQGLGQNQYNQQIGIAGLQNQFGTQQQALQQQQLDTNYQDFQNQSLWPYKQLEFQSGMLRGLPLSQTTTSMYEPAPSPISQMAGLGTAMYGMSKMAGGGFVRDETGRRNQFSDERSTLYDPEYRAAADKYDGAGITTALSPDAHIDGWRMAEKERLETEKKPKGKKKYAKGGKVQDVPYREKSGGLAELLISQIN